MKTAFTRIALATACLAFAGQTSGCRTQTPGMHRPGCKPGGGFDLTCKLAQSALLQDASLLKSPMRVTYMPGGVGAVAYNAVVAQRPADAGTITAFSSGSLAQPGARQVRPVTTKTAREAGWPAVGTRLRCPGRACQDSPYKTLDDLVTALKDRSGQQW